jgi:hypothetical protein
LLVARPEAVYGAWPAYDVIEPGEQLIRFRV